MHNRQTVAFALLILVSMIVGCAKDPLADLPMFKKIARGKKFAEQAFDEFNRCKGNPLPLKEDLKKLDGAIKLIKQAIEAVPQSLNYNFFFAKLLYNKGLYHDCQSTYWKNRAGGFKFVKETDEWVKERPLPPREERDKWDEKARQHRELAAEYLNRVLNRLDILDRLRSDIPRFLDLRANTYILLLEYAKARAVYVELARDSRLTDGQRKVALDMIGKIDRNEFYQKRKKKEESSIYEKDEFDVDIEKEDKSGP